VSAVRAGLHLNGFQRDILRVNRNAFKLFMQLRPDSVLFLVGQNDDHVSSPAPGSGRISRRRLLLALLQRQADGALDVWLDSVAPLTVSRRTRFPATMDRQSPPPRRAAVPVLEDLHASDSVILHPHLDFRVNQPASDSP
jgi:hypothetical protein